MEDLILRLKNCNTNYNLLKNLIDKCESSRLPIDRVLTYLNSIYNISNNDDLLILEYFFAAYLTPLCKKLLYYYDKIRPDDFEGWDAPVTYQYKGRKGKKSLSESGLPMPNRGDIVDSTFPKDAPLVTIIINVKDNLPILRLTIESIYNNTRGINYELYIRDNESVEDDMIFYFNRLPRLKGYYRTEPNWDYNTDKYHEIEEWSENIRGRYIVTIKSETIVTPKWLDNLLAVVENDETVGLVLTNNHMVGRTDLKCSGVSEIKTYKEIIDYADKNNMTEPRTWQERFDMNSSVVLMTYETFLIVKSSDSNFFDLYFDNEDYALRVRQSSLKIICAKDSYSHVLQGIAQNGVRILSSQRSQAGKEVFDKKWQHNCL